MPFPEKKNNKEMRKHRASIEKLRGTLIRPASPNNYDYEEYQVAINTRIFNRIRVYRPNARNSDTFPTLLYVPATGFNTLVPEFSNAVCSNIVKISGYQVIVIHHRLAPEYPFPVGLQDAYGTMKIIFKNTKLLKIDKENVRIAGYSSGGTIAVSMAIMAAKEKITLRDLYLISPVADFTRSLNDYSDWEAEDTFSENLLRWFIKIAVHDSDKKNPKLSPYWSNDLSYLPPTFLTYGEYDRTRGDAEGLGNKLAKSGIQVGKIVIENATHISFWNNPDIVLHLAELLKRGYINYNNEVKNLLGYPNMSQEFCDVGEPKRRASRQKRKLPKEAPGLFSIPDSTQVKKHKQNSSPTSSNQKQKSSSKRGLFASNNKYTHVTCRTSDGRFTANNNSMSMVS